MRMDIDGVSNSTRQCIARLLYPVQFEKKLEDGIDRVIENLRESRAKQPSWQQYISAVEEALNSNIDLAKIIPVNHSHQEIAEYLRKFRDRLIHCPPPPASPS